MFKTYAPSKSHTASARRGGRLLPGVLLAMSIAAAGSFVTAGPAAAADASDCSTANTVCLYSGENFTGDRITFTASGSSGTCVNLADAGWTQKTNSVVNTNSLSAVLFMNPNCVGDPFQVPGNSSKAQLGSFTPTSLFVPPVR